LVACGVAVVNHRGVGIGERLPVPAP